MKLEDLGSEWRGTLHVYHNVKHGYLHFSQFDDPAGGEHVMVGRAEVVIPLSQRDEIVSKQLAALRNAQQKLRAEAQRRDDELEQQIQSLLALPHLRDDCFDGGAA